MPYKTAAILANIQYIIIYQSVFNAVAADIDLLRLGKRTKANPKKNRPYSQEEFQWAKGKKFSPLFLGKSS
jgi:hypothetical protein